MVERFNRTLKTKHSAKFGAQWDKIGDWVLVWFPSRGNCSPSETLSTMAWSLSSQEPDVTVVKVYYPQDGQLKIHNLALNPVISTFLLVITGVDSKDMVLADHQSGLRSCSLKHQNQRKM